MEFDDLFSMIKYIKPLKKTVSDFMFPPMCQGCGERVSEPNSICSHCWQDIHFITAPYCPVMGIPFQFDPGIDFLSGEALQNPPLFNKVRSAVIHDGLARQLISKLKYSDRVDLAPAMAEWMISAGKDFMCESDMIVPIPLHRWRFFFRRFNQAAELARFIANKTNTPFTPELLKRHKSTRHQVGLPAKERIINVKGAFNVSKKAKKMLKNKNILVVDDVYTTGATVNAAAKCLKKAGASKVFVLTFSRALPRLVSDPVVEFRQTPKQT